MHVHPNYNLNLAALGSNRDELHEIAARRAAEVRRRLTGLANTATAEDDDVAFVKAAEDSDSPPNAYSAADGEEVAAKPNEREASADPGHGSLFSAVA